MVSRPADGTWQINKPSFIGVWNGGLYADEPRIAISSDGTQNVVWEQELDADEPVRYPVAYAAWRIPKRGWSQPTNLSPTSGAFAEDPELVVGPKGTATSAWALADTSGSRIQVSTTLPAYCHEATLDRERGRSNLKKGTAEINATVGTPGRLWVTGSPDVKPFTVYAKRKGAVACSAGSSRRCQAAAA